MSCTTSSFYSAGCTKCSTTTYSKDGRYCSTFITDVCDECIPIDEDIYNSYISIVRYRGGICFSRSTFQRCYNPDSNTGTCVNFNPGCDGCCLRVNSKDSICPRSDPTAEFCTNKYNDDVIEVYDSSIEGYSGFILSITLIIFLFVFGFLIFYFIRKPSLPDKILRYVNIGGKYYIILCILLLLIQLCLCYTSWACSQTNQAAIAFIILSSLLVLALVLELKDGMLSKRIGTIKTLSIYNANNKVIPDSSPPEIIELPEPPKVLFASQSSQNQYHPLPTPDLENLPKEVEINKNEES